MNLVAVYGSLRKGEYNYEHFNNEEMKFIDTIEVEGYDLYSLGPYPGIKKGDNNLICDLFLMDNDTMKDIDSMEVNAGYKIDTIKTKYGTAKIYVYKGAIKESDKVESGNWVTRNKKICVD